jgi:hypothetical protein
MRNQLENLRTKAQAALDDPNSFVAQGDFAIVASPKDVLKLLDEIARLQAEVASTVGS